MDGELYMTNDIEFVLYWDKVRKRFLPILEQQIQMWDKARRYENNEKIEKELRPCLEIICFEAAKELLIICKEQENQIPTELSPLKSLFTNLKEIIIAVAKETPGLSPDYLDFIAKLTSPRRHTTIVNSRWARLKQSSSGSDTDNQELENTQRIFAEPEKDEADLLPRSIYVKEIRPETEGQKTEETVVYVPKL
jgi:hypothetical protein